MLSPTPGAASRQPPFPPRAALPACLPLPFFSLYGSAPFGAAQTQEAQGSFPLRPSLAASGGWEDELLLLGGDLTMNSCPTLWLANGQIPTGDLTELDREEAPG